VFEIFVQAKRSTDGVLGELGLGLSLVKSMVDAHGGKVIAYSELEALKQAEQKRLDVAILDIGLPDTDGYTLARQFKAMPHQSAAKLVAVTGYGTAQNIFRAYEAGFDQHIVKPIDCDLLLTELTDVVALPSQ